MSTPLFAIRGGYRCASSSADADLEAQTTSGTHTFFALPVVPRPAQAAPLPTRTSHISTRTTVDAIDDLFGVIRPRATRKSQHDPHPSLGGTHHVLLPSYADADLPAYSVDPSTEPVTLAKYLFKLGFLFPLFWVMGAMIWISPLTAPADFEPSKSEKERGEIVQVIRDTELRWAKRCVLALLGLFILVGLAVAITLAVLRS